MEASAIESDAYTFVSNAKAKGVDDQTILGLLRNAGWTERRALRLLGTYYAEAEGLNVPARPTSAENARDAFYYLLNFITLGSWAVALGHIGYTLIAYRFPDAAQDTIYGQSLMDQLSWQIATVVVSFPIFAFVHVRLARLLRERPDLYESGVRKWLTYVALVIAALVVIGDGVWFVNAFLRGELTVRFILDEVLLLVLGGGIFAFYLSTIDAPRAAKAQT